MKKSPSRKTGLPFFSELRGAFFAFLFVLLLASAYAAVSYPPPPSSVSGVLGTYVGSTSGVYDGATAGSYEGTHASCADAFEGSHVCTPMEIINTYNHKPDGLISGAFGVTWLNSGAPANISPSVNDCNGWTDNSFSSYANVWNFDNAYAGILPCGYQNRYACCY